jgi:hypothetical protein
MSDIKIQSEKPDKAPPPVNVDQAEEKHNAAGPARAAIQRAPQAQTTTTPAPTPAPMHAPAKALDLLGGAEPGSGAPGRARTMNAMQQSVGNTRISRLMDSPQDAASPDRLQRQTTAQGGQSTVETGSAAEIGAATSLPAFVTAPLETRMAATVLAEAWAGQEADIRWVYYNNIMQAKGETGLKASSAYRTKEPWYRIWLYMLGDHSYGNTDLPRTKEFAGFGKVKDFCTRNGYMRSVATARAAQAKALVEEVFANPTTNPVAGWTGQGSLDDFNGKSDPKNPDWKMARAYYWLQAQNKVQDTYVKVLPAGKHTQFMFDKQAIRRYYQHHRLPENVPLYSPPR